MPKGQRKPNSLLQQGPEESNDVLRLPSLDDVVGRGDEVEPFQGKLPQVSQAAQLRAELNDLVVTEVEGVERGHVTHAERHLAYLIVAEYQSVQ